VRIDFQEGTAKSIAHGVATLIMLLGSRRVRFLPSCLPKLTAVQERKKGAFITFIL